MEGPEIHQLNHGGVWVTWKQGGRGPWGAEPGGGSRPPPCMHCHAARAAASAATDATALARPGGQTWRDSDGAHGQLEGPAAHPATGGNAAASRWARHWQAAPRA